MPNKIMSCQELDKERPITIVPQHHYSISSDTVLSTYNLQQCCAVVMFDPVENKAALLHVDINTNASSITSVYNEIYNGNTLNIHMVGGEATKKDPISKHNVRKVLAELQNKDVDILSADTRGKTHTTAIAFDPKSGELYKANNILRQRYTENDHPTTESFGFPYSGYKAQFSDFLNPQYLKYFAKELWRSARLLSASRASVSESRAKYQLHTQSNNSSDLREVPNQFYLAITNGDKNVIVNCLASGIRLNQSNKNDETPLFVACQFDKPEIARLFLVQGADINATNKDGFTPLEVSAYNGHIDCVTVLLENKAAIGAALDGANEGKKENPDPVYDKIIDSLTKYHSEQTHKTKEKEKPVVGHHTQDLADSRENTKREK